MSGSRHSRFASLHDVELCSHAATGERRAFGELVRRHGSAVRGVLRRMATTPVRPVSLLGAQLAMDTLVAIVAGVLVLIVGRVFFHVGFPDNPAAYVLAFLLTAGAAFAIGLFVAAIAPSGKAANSIGTFLFFIVATFAIWTQVHPFIDLQDPSALDDTTRAASCRASARRL